MRARSAILLALFSLPFLVTGCASIDTDSRPWHVVSDTPAGGFAFPESVGCDSSANVLYVSQFGGTELKPAEKDGKGFISKVGLDGTVIQKRAFDVTLNKPKGIWIEGLRLWVTDIDSVWIFDTASRRGRKLELPGIQFANDPAVQRGVLYVSDNRSDKLFRIEPADFLDERTPPTVTVAWAGKSVFPNGLWPSRRSGALLLVGFQSADQPRGIYAMGADGEVKALSAMLGRLDGLHETWDGLIFATDWNSGSFFQWTASTGVKPLATGFKGPADFCVMNDTAYVPDLVQGQVRILKLGR